MHTKAKMTKVDRVTLNKTIAPCHNDGTEHKDKSTLETLTYWQTDVLHKPPATPLLHNH